MGAVVTVAALAILAAACGSSPKSSSPTTTGSSTGSAAGSSSGSNKASANVDGAVCSCVQNSNIAMDVAAKQARIPPKAALMFSGADASLFDNATATSAAQGTYWPTTIVPIDLHNPATDQFIATLKQYDPSYKGGYPSYGLTGSYLSADLMIQGLKLAGQNPTRQSFIDNLTKVTAWNAEGLLPSTVGFNHFGSVEPKLCGYFTKVQENQFVTINIGKPFCGAEIPTGQAPSAKSAPRSHRAESLREEVKHGSP